MSASPDFDSFVARIVRGLQLDLSVPPKLKKEGIEEIGVLLQDSKDNYNVNDLETAGLSQRDAKLLIDCVNFDSFVKGLVRELQLDPRVPSMLKNAGIGDLVALLRENDVFTLQDVGLTARDASLLIPRAITLVYPNTSYTDAWFNAVACRNGGPIFKDDTGDSWRPIPNSFYRTGYSVSVSNAFTLLIHEIARLFETRFMFRTVCDDAMCTHHPLVWARVVPNGFDTPLLVAEQKCYGMSLRCAGPSNCEFKDEGAAAGTWSVPEGMDTVLYARDFTKTNDSLHDSPVMFVRADDYDTIQRQYFSDAEADWHDTRDYSIASLEELARQALRVHEPTFTFPNLSTRVAALSHFRPLDLSMQ